MRGIIFDFDGLILDTETPDFQSWQEIFRAHNAELPLDLWATSICSIDGGFDPYTYLETQIGRSIDRDAVRQQRRQRDLELIAAQPIQPGVLAYLADAKRMNLKIGLASNSPHAWVEGHLNRFGLMAYFDDIKCIEDVPHGKPEPDIYQTVTSALALRPSETLALEDSPNGLLAAKRAGLFCVAVPNVMTRELAFEHADVRLGSLAEIPLDTLLMRAQSLQTQP
jgi:HAD superfamily hydrolase (TIGR01509 family)